MRNTRKWLVLLLTVVMLVSNLNIAAMAAENESPIALAASSVAGSGNEIQVQILATKAQTVADGKLVVTFDAEKLTYTGAETGAAWGEDQVTLSVNPSTGKVILAFANAEAAAEGVLFTLSFEAAADAVVAIDGSSYITGIDADLSQQISTCPSSQFTDLGDLTSAAHDAVDFMVANGYMVGVAETAFGPHNELNRAMMVTILYRVAGTPEFEGSNRFTDVPADAYYADPVTWAFTNGITAGVTENLFAPGKSLTRQELVAFLYRYAKLSGQDMTPSADLSAYTDAGKIQPFAMESFQWAVANGIIRGTSETTLDPEATTTRAQVSMMVHRMLSSWE